MAALLLSKCCSLGISQHSWLSWSLDSAPGIFPSAHPFQLPRDLESPLQATVSGVIPLNMGLYHHMLLSPWTTPFPPKSSQTAPPPAP